jgi:hypothetical protein
MKTPNAERVSAGRGAKDKKQLIVLGGLVAVLAVALSSQFSSEEETVSAATPPLDTAVGGIQDSANRITEAENMMAVPDNVALSSSPSEASVRSSPFESFWSVDAPIDTTIEQIPAPSITLNGTMTSARKPLAVIDGETRYIDDMVQGWRLVSIGSREVELESPTKTKMTVEMPLLKLTNRRKP